MKINIDKKQINSEEIKTIAKEVADLVERKIGTMAIVLIRLWVNTE